MGLRVCLGLGEMGLCVRRIEVCAYTWHLFSRGVLQLVEVVTFEDGAPGMGVAVLGALVCARQAVADASLDGYGEISHAPAGIHDQVGVDAKDDAVLLVHQSL